MEELEEILKRKELEERSLMSFNEHTLKLNSIDQTNEMHGIGIQPFAKINSSFIGKPEEKGGNRTPPENFSTQVNRFPEKNQMLLETPQKKSINFVKERKNSIDEKHKPTHKRSFSEENIHKLYINPMENLQTAKSKVVKGDASQPPRTKPEGVNLFENIKTPTLLSGTRALKKKVNKEIPVHEQMNRENLPVSKQQVGSQQDAGTKTEPKVDQKNKKTVVAKNHKPVEKEKKPIVFEEMAEKVPPPSSLLKRTPKAAETKDEKEKIANEPKIDKLKEREENPINRKDSISPKNTISKVATRKMAQQKPPVQEEMCEKPLPKSGGRNMTSKPSESPLKFKEVMETVKQAPESRKARKAPFIFKQEKKPPRSKISGPQNYSSIWESNLAEPVSADATYQIENHENRSEKANSKKSSKAESPNRQAIEEGEKKEIKDFDGLPQSMADWIPCTEQI